MNRRALLLSTSAAALATIIGSDPADAQLGRLFRGGGPRYKGGGGPRPSTGQCPAGGSHAWARADDGRNPKIAYMRCLKCGLIRPMFGMPR